MACLNDEVSLIDEILTIVTENDALKSSERKMYCETSVLIDDDIGSFLLLPALRLATKTCYSFVSCSRWEEGLCIVASHTLHLLLLQGCVQCTSLCSRRRQ